MLLIYWTDSWRMHLSAVTSSNKSCLKVPVAWRVVSMETQTGRGKNFRLFQMSWCDYTDAAGCLMGDSGWNPRRCNEDQTYKRDRYIRKIQSLKHELLRYLSYINVFSLPARFNLKHQLWKLLKTIFWTTTQPWTRKLVIWYRIIFE